MSIAVLLLICTSTFAQPWTPTPDGNDCTLDVVDPSTGGTSYLPINCDDGIASTMDTCLDGTCVTSALEVPFTVQHIHYGFVLQHGDLLRDMDGDTAQLVRALIAPTDPDVITVSGVWDLCDNPMATLITDLSPTYPYHHVSETDNEVDSGVGIFSKYPIVSRDRLTFNAEFGPAARLGRGALYAQVEVPIPNPGAAAGDLSAFVDVFSSNVQNRRADFPEVVITELQRWFDCPPGFIELLNTFYTYTHDMIQSVLCMIEGCFETPDEAAQATAVRQMRELASFVTTHLTGHPAVLTGEFGVPNGQGQTDNGFWTEQLSILRGCGGNLCPDDKALYPWIDALAEYSNGPSPDSLSKLAVMNTAAYSNMLWQIADAYTPLSVGSLPLGIDEALISAVAGVATLAPTELRRIRYAVDPVLMSDPSDGSPLLPEWPTKALAEYGRFFLLGLQRTVPTDRLLEIHFHYGPTTNNKPIEIRPRQPGDGSLTTHIVISSHSSITWIHGDGTGTIPDGTTVLSLPVAMLHAAGVALGGSLNAAEYPFARLADPAYLSQILSEETLSDLDACSSNIVCTESDGSTSTNSGVLHACPSPSDAVMRHQAARIYANEPNWLDTLASVPCSATVNGPAVVTSILTGDDIALMRKVYGSRPVDAILPAPAPNLDELESFMGTMMTNLAKHMQYQRPWAGITSFELRTNWGYASWETEPGDSLFQEVLGHVTDNIWGLITGVPGIGLRFWGSSCADKDRDWCIIIISGFRWHCWDIGWFDICIPVPTFAELCFRDSEEVRFGFAVDSSVPGISFGRSLWPPPGPWERDGPGNANPNIGSSTAIGIDRIDTILDRVCVHGHYSCWEEDSGLNGGDDPSGNAAFDLCVSLDPSKGPLQHTVRAGRDCSRAELTLMLSSPEAADISNLFQEEMTRRAIEAGLKELWSDSVPSLAGLAQGAIGAIDPNTAPGVPFGTLTNTLTAPMDSFQAELELDIIEAEADEASTQLRRDLIAVFRTRFPEPTSAREQRLYLRNLREWVLRQLDRTSRLIWNGVWSNFGGLTRGSGPPPPPATEIPPALYMDMYNAALFMNGVDIVEVVSDMYDPADPRLFAGMSEDVMLAAFEENVAAALAHVFPGGVPADGPVFELPDHLIFALETVFQSSFSINEIGLSRQLVVEAEGPTGVAVDHPEVEHWMSLWTNTLEGTPGVAWVTDSGALNRGSWPLGSTNIHLVMSLDSPVPDVTVGLNLLVVDTTPPVVTVPDYPVMVSITALQGAVLDLPVHLASHLSAFDAVDTNVPVEIVELPEILPIGTHTLAARATDAAGNMGDAMEFVVSVSVTQRIMIWGEEHVEFTGNDDLVDEARRRLNSPGLVGTGPSGSMSLHDISTDGQGQVTLSSPAMEFVSTDSNIPVAYTDSCALFDGSFVNCSDVFAAVAKFPAFPVTPFDGPAMPVPPPGTPSWGTVRLGCTRNNKGKFTGQCGQADLALEPGEALRSGSFSSVIADGELQLVQGDEYWIDVLDIKSGCNIVVGPAATRASAPGQESNVVVWMAVGGSVAVVSAVVMVVSSRRLSQEDDGELTAGAIRGKADRRRSGGLSLSVGVGIAAVATLAVAAVLLWAPVFGPGDAGSANVEYTQNDLVARVYVTGLIDGGQHLSVDSGSEPGGLVIMSAQGGDLSLGGPHASIVGLHLSAPNADVQVKPGTSWMGSVAGKTIQVFPNVLFGPSETLCPPGTFWDSSSGLNRVRTACAVCPEGLVSQQRDSREYCVPCPTGYEANEEQTDCVLCAAGAARSFGLGRERGQCETCPPGYVAPYAGMGVCDACPVGTYSNGPTQCSNCPAGTFQPEIGAASSVADCAPCPAGEISGSGSKRCAPGDGAVEHGICIGGACACDKGWTGAVCQLCRPGFYGPDCLPCNVDNCGSRGVCDDGLSGTGACVCLEGWTGVDCDECLPGYYGQACTPCEGDCGSHGLCMDGRNGTGGCACDAEWEGEACDDCAPDHYGPDCTPCTVDCGGHGSCNDTLTGDGTCVCASSWAGENCDEECADEFFGPECLACNATCMRGFCDSGLEGTGTCICDPGFTGPNCTDCFPGHYGEDCEGLCDCNPIGGGCFEGVIGNGTCFCGPGWEGVSCEDCQPSWYGGEDRNCTECSVDCSGHGSCDDGIDGSGTCVCDAGWTGASCDIEVCDPACANGGSCSNGQCVCLSGWHGPACEQETCDPSCVHGTCDGGTCACDSGFSGGACDIPL